MSMILAASYRSYTTCVVGSPSNYQWKSLKSQMLSGCNRRHDRWTEAMAESRCTKGRHITTVHNIAIPKNVARVRHIPASAAENIATSGNMGATSKPVVTSAIRSCSLGPVACPPAGCRLLIRPSRRREGGCNVRVASWHIL